METVGYDDLERVPQWRGLEGLGAGRPGLVGADVVDQSVTQVSQVERARRMSDDLTTCQYQGAHSVQSTVQTLRLYRMLTHRMPARGRVVISLSVR